jgi:hypothetical protein
MDLDKILALANAATKGPWGEDDGHIFSVPMNDAFFAWCASPASGKEHRPKDAEVALCSQSGENFEANSEFIAWAREGVPALVAEVKRLEALSKSGEGE